MQIGDDSRTLDQGPYQNLGGEEVGLPQQLTDTQGNVDSLRNDLAGGVLEVSQRIPVDVRVDRYPLIG
jgi:hypothetical protein